ncbi:hypothetical protein CDD83_3368 [Cordyceps sp. RAO-2017]|nr:hypothetical protein CDD83_3368 [Cordyceps sp. RAO-2017]
MEQDASLRQPNFSLAAESMRTVADQLERCGNLPAVDGGARLAETLQTVLERIDALERTIHHRIDTLERTIHHRIDTLEKTVHHRIDVLESTMQRRFDEVEQRMTDLDRKMTFSNRNAIARAHNGTVERGDTPLQRPYSLLTGDLIDGFPSNMDQMDRLHGRDVDNLLRHLGESDEGSAAEKKRRLKLASGLIKRLL